MMDVMLKVGIEQQLADVNKSLLSSQSIINSLIESDFLHKMDVQDIIQNPQSLSFVNLLNIEAEELSRQILRIVATMNTISSATTATTAKSDDDKEQQQHDE